DPATGPFLGSTPNSEIDLPATITFLVLFAVGAITHICIYRFNSKRGHKFLLSDLVFDFCMIRTLTCIFRIIWIFLPARGVILTALIFENGGAAVLFAVNVILLQRIIRSMHPRFGWHPAFGILGAALALSAPLVIIVNIVALSVGFFSVENEKQLLTTDTILKVGASWNMMLAALPAVALLLASSFPGPKVERFGAGPLRLKITLLVYSSITLAIGAAVRLATFIDPVPSGTEDRSIIFCRATFYVTGFSLEILVVFFYAIGRIDLRFHVPNGSSKYGDYS
ncbi:hypothetical protein GQ53DRAFT_621662, partial [Thozetella sp. PMI_491]